ncbi:hypothetical protein PAMP_014494 [Pampus punctatissimus]
MTSLVLQLVFIGVYIQVSTCYPSCTLYNLIADCSSRGHRSVPALPPSITHLFLVSNYISEINNSSLRNLEQLQKLDLGRQRVRLVIRNDSFLMQKNLIELVLESNLRLQLEPRAFTGLSNLQKLDLGYCMLKNSILTENYLQPLLSLETLNLFRNNIVRLQPGLFFLRLTKFTELNLKLNQIDRLCEKDLDGFRGKYFKHLNLHSNPLSRMFSSRDLDLKECGNPFRDIAINTLDLSTNGFNLISLEQFLNAINGTQISHLILYSYIGKGFSYNNLPDPDSSTFKGLMNSKVKIFDMSKNYIHTLERGVFSPLQDVTVIDISKNQVNQIDKHAFIGLQEHLEILNLSSNLLGEVCSHTFNHLTELLLLDLSHNHIGILGAKAFRGLPKLQTLLLSGNSLRTLGSPEPLPSLKVLFLNDNKLKSVYQINTLGNNSIIVNIEDNKLTNLEDVYNILNNFKHLKNLFYGGNIVKWCNPRPSVPRNNSLEWLDLYDSSLQIIWAEGKCLDLFDHLGNLHNLNLSFNSLATLPRGIFSGLSSIIEIDLSSNALTYLPQDVFPVSLKTLDLSKNYLASPDPTAFQSLHVNLAENRFHCDCNLESFLTWFNKMDALRSVEHEYKCAFPASLSNFSLLDYSKIFEPCEKDDEMAVQDLKFALFILSAFIIITAILSMIVYTHLRGHVFVIYKKVANTVLNGPKPPAPVEELQYDAYICFSDSDYKWVEAALLKKLDKQFSEKNILRCCFEARDFLPGVDHLSNIRDAICCSRKTVCIVSKEFLKDGWCLEAFMLAQGWTLEERTDILIMLVVGKLMKNNAIRAFIQKRQYLTWPEDSQDLEWFYEQLVSKILKDAKVKKPAEDKPELDVQPQNEERIQLENIRAVAM